MIKDEYGIEKKRYVYSTMYEGVKPQHETGIRIKLNKSKQRMEKMNSTMTTDFLSSNNNSIDYLNST